MEFLEIRVLIKEKIQGKVQKGIEKLLWKKVEIRENIFKEI